MMIKKITKSESQSNSHNTKKMFNETTKSNSDIESQSNTDYDSHNNNKSDSDIESKSNTDYDSHNNKSDSDIESKSNTDNGSYNNIKMFDKITKSKSYSNTNNNKTFDTKIKSDSDSNTLSDSDNESYNKKSKSDSESDIESQNNSNNKKKMINKILKSDSDSKMHNNNFNTRGRTSPCGSADGASTTIKSNSDNECLIYSDSETMIDSDSESQSNSDSESQSNSDSESLCDSDNNSYNKTKKSSTNSNSNKSLNKQQDSKNKINNNNRFIFRLYRSTAEFMKKKLLKQISLIENETVTEDNTYKTVCNFIEKLKKNKKFIKNDVIQVRFYICFVYTFTLNMCEYFLVRDISLCHSYFSLFYNAGMKTVGLNPINKNIWSVCALGTELCGLLKKIFLGEENKDYKFNNSFVQVIDFIMESEEKKPSTPDFIITLMAAFINHAIQTELSHISYELTIPNNHYTCPLDKKEINKKKELIMTNVKQFLTFYPWK